MKAFDKIYVILKLNDRKEKNRWWATLFLIYLLINKVIWEIEYYYYYLFG
jgi:hypothetical protein